jgi:O-acetyl-ADP-ribose deacetylase (regulator of RNase III)
MWIAVGPVWQGGGNQEEDHLYLCIESALKESENRNLSSIAIPALCTGIFGYPSKEATKVICEAFFLNRHSYFPFIMFFFPFFKVEIP